MLLNPSFENSIHHTKEEVLYTKPTVLFVFNVDWFFVSHSLPLANSLVLNDYDVHVACASTSDLQFLSRYGFVAHQLPISRSNTKFFVLFYELWLTYQLIRTIKPDLVYSATIKPVFFSSVACWLANFKTPLVVSIPGLGHVSRLDTRFGALKRFLLLLAYRCVLKLPANVVAIIENQDDRDLLVKSKCIPAPCARLFSGIGVNLSEFSPTPLPSCLPVVLFAGRLIWSKGIIDFIEAARIVKNAKFVVAGTPDPGNPASVDISFLNKWQEDNLIEYRGHVAAMPYLIKESYVVVLPSYYGEGLPKILMEAAASGRPIVTTDHPGCREAVINGVTGLLVPPRDPCSLARAIQYLIDNFDICQNMALEARTFAEVSFDSRKFVAANIKIIEDLIAQV